MSEFHTNYKLNSLDKFMILVHVSVISHFFPTVYTYYRLIWCALIEVYRYGVHYLELTASVLQCALFRILSH